MPTGTLTISQYTANPPQQVDSNSLLEVRGWYSRDYVSVDGVTPIFGNTTSGEQGPYYSTTPTLNASGEVVVPAHVVQITVGANPTANYFEGLWVDGAFVMMLMPNNNVTSGWQIPDVYGDPIAYDEIATYNRAKRLVYPPDTYFTADQVIQEIERIAGNFAYAAVNVNGITSLSFPPVVTSEPIALSENDPRVASFVNVISAGAVGDDSTNNVTAFTNAQIVAASTGAALYIPVGTFRLIGGFAFTSPVVFAPGASIVKHLGGSISFAKEIVADTSQHFASTGTISVTFSATAPLNLIYPEWWGAIPDDSTICTTAIQSAVTAAISRSVVWLSSGTYRVDGSITATGNTALTIKGNGLTSKIKNVASANKPTLRFTTKLQLLLEDFAIIGQTANPNEGILIEDNSAYIVMNRVMTNSSGVGVHLQDSSSIWINNHQFWPSGFTNGATSTAGGAQITNAILADGTFVNNVHINALNTNNYAKISDGGACIRWNTPGFSASQGITITGCEMEDSVAPSRCIDLKGVTDVIIQGNYIDGTNVRILQSRYVLAVSNYGSASTSYSIGDNTPGNENQNVLIEGAPTGTATFDQYCILCGSHDSNFDTSPGYVNNGSRPVTQNTRTTAGVVVPDQIGSAGIKERDRTLSLGQFTTPTFSALNFTSPTGAWTLASGDVTTYEYQVVGTTMTVNFRLVTTTVTGTPAALLIAIPGGYTSAARASGVFIGNSNGGAFFTSEMEVTSGGTTIVLYPALNGIGTWAAGTDNTNVRGSFSFEVS